MTEEQKEKRKNRNAMILSLSIHAALILLFVFLVAWREPNPPLPEYGIEINFGTDDAGTGDVQPETESIDSEETEEPAPSDDLEAEDVQEEQVEEVEEVIEEVVEEVETQEVVDETVTEDDNSPDLVEDVEEVVPEPVEDKEEEVKQPEIEKEEENKDSGSPVSGEGEADTTPEANQGDKKDETGDQGSEDGKIDARSLYGTPGSGGGSSLNMAGWIWDEIPTPDDTSDEEGKIVFDITIDDQGYIISIKTIETTVSAAVEKIYRSEVENLTFSKTDNNPPAPRSTGRITFIIKAR